MAVVVYGGRNASKVRRTAMNEVTATFEITVSGIHPKTVSKPTHRNQSACNTNLRPGSGDIGTLSRWSIHDAMLWNNGAAGLTAAAVHAANRCVEHDSRSRIEDCPQARFPRR